MQALIALDKCLVKAAAGVGRSVVKAGHGEDGELGAEGSCVQ